MLKVDLHVHSKYSAHPSEWFLKRIGTSESYTEPDMIYTYAKKRGMDFVTITDHNLLEGSLYLTDKYPDDTFTGVEVTSYFPHDRCKIHILVWGLNENQFILVNKIRRDIFQLRAYLKEEKLAHSVAHATFNINRRLSIEHIEQLILLFDYFEGINGCRSKNSNDTCMNALQSITPDIINDLYHKYHIEPFSDTPWRKSFSGGSDDHCGLFIGKTFTQITGKDMSPHKFLEAFRAKKSMPMGRHNNYHDFAFSLYKITYEFAKSRSTAFSSSLLYSISKVLFDGSTTGFRNKLFLKKMKITAKPEKKALILQIENLLKDFESMSNSSIEEKMDIMYEHTSLIVDELIGSFIKSFEKHMSEGNIAGTIQNLSSLLPAVFITIPFFTTINVLHESQELLDTINLKYNKHSRKKRKKYLWFTDTLTDLNGVSETIQKIGKLSFVNNIDVMIAACIPDNEITDNLPSNICQLPCFTTYTASFFNTYTLRIPSILHALKKLYAQQPDEIFISTPGPVGLLGLLLARLMHIPCKGIYHTDFTDYARTIIDDPAITAMTREYVKWFYSQCNTIYVPTLEYISILENRGYSPEKMKKFLRAVDQNVFSPQKIQTDYLEQKYSIKSGINILYVGRISREKNINKLFTIYYQLKKQKEALNLILCGNGPLYGEYREKYKKDKRVCFLGRLDRNELPLLYTATDLLVFPSTTDTFGMAVLEAQACGLPAIVSDKGGPQEIIIDTVTGYTARHDSVNDWIEKINRIINSIELYPEQYLEMRFRACKMVESKYNWNNVLKNLFNYNDPIVFTPLSNNTKRTMPTEILV